MRPPKIFLPFTKQHIYAEFEDLHRRTRASRIREICDININRSNETIRITFCCICVNRDIFRWTMKIWIARIKTGVRMKLNQLREWTSWCMTKLAVSYQSRYQVPFWPHIVWESSLLDHDYNGSALKRGDLCLGKHPSLRRTFFNDSLNQLKIFQCPKLLRLKYLTFHQWWWAWCIWDCLCSKNTETYNTTESITFTTK